MSKTHEKLIDKDKMSAMTSIIDRGPFGYSRASSRYEGDGRKSARASDRNRILLEWVGAGTRVLEVGCSTGYMSRELKEQGCRVTGIEVDAAAAEKAHEHCSEVYVLDLNIPDWIQGFPERGFDVILLADVLEHLMMPDVTLQQLRLVLSSNGKLAISLPNVVHWITRTKIAMGNFNYESWGTLDHTHLRFFTIKTARALIEAAGYRVTKFQPVIGGTLAGRAPFVLRWLACTLPGLFAYQMLFEAEKIG